MKSSYAAYYQALELPDTATPEDVKRAYFRLVRKYSPEKDPERFRVIREAYEALRDGGAEPEEETSFTPPEDSVVQMFVSFADQDIRLRDLRGAIKNMETALSYQPEDPYLLNRLVQLQMKAGHSQKAAKTAEQLTKVVPESRTAWTLLARALLERGWIKKALPAYRKSYVLGEKSLGFLNDYSYVLGENGDQVTCEQICREVLRRGKWDEKDILYAINAYVGLAAKVKQTEKSLLALLEEYRAFLKKYKRLLKNQEDAMGFFQALLKDENLKTVMTASAYARSMEILAETESLFPETEEMAEELRAIYTGTAIAIHPANLDDAWSKLAYLPSMASRIDETQKRYMTLDWQMCLLAEPEKNQAQAEIIREAFPFLYQRIPELADALVSGETKELARKTEWEFRRLVDLFTGSDYLARFGKKATKKESTDQSFLFASEEPYVREQEKVGRNDPCPCGSGKKFKKCCMGKGLYD